VFVALVEAARFLGGYLSVLSRPKLTHNQVTDCDQALHAEEWANRKFKTVSNGGPPTYQTEICLT
jgi:hypothetical protein